MKIAAVIPARLRSTRFPNKILLPIHGLPMIEHVRRRALMCPTLSEVVVATCDVEIAEVVRANGGRVIMTSDSHTNGTTRIAEAVAEVDCSHVLLLQGDEPLLLPRHIEALAEAVIAEPGISAWNLVGALEEEEELDRRSFVKCAVVAPHHIIYCFRRSPNFSNFAIQKAFVRKMLGIIAYRKDFLLKLTNLEASPIEIAESIEQMRILENGFSLNYVEVSPALPSINEPCELKEVLDRLLTDREQQDLLKTITNQ
jgi:3-deoxy-manno-octulosonate cytidylyltransferase (CMP-KDO synthetase)